jgi:hypothetical protein
VLSSIELVRGFLENIHKQHSLPMEIFVHLFIGIAKRATVCRPKTNDRCARKMHREGQYVETY